MMEGDTPRPANRPMDNISLFLRFVKENHLRDYLMAKERSMGYTKEEHMPGHIRMGYTIMAMTNGGQIQSSLTLIYVTNAEFRTSQSIEHWFGDNVTKQELKHYYEQHVHEERMQTPKKSWWRRDR